MSINLSGTLDVSAHTGNTGKGQSLLLVAWGARSSSQINADLVMNVSSQVGETGRYTLISEMGFMVALVPPQTTGVLTYGDAAGNLDEGWELPTADGARSSLIRREMDTAGMATMGTMANGWVLASSTALVSGGTRLPGGMVAMKMLELPAMMLVVRYPFNFHISVLPVIETLAQR